MVRGSSTSRRKTRSTLGTNENVAQQLLLEELKCFQGQNHELAKNLAETRRLNAQLSYERDLMQKQLWGSESNVKKFRQYFQEVGRLTVLSTKALLEATQYIDRICVIKDQAGSLLTAFKDNLEPLSAQSLEESISPAPRQDNFVTSRSKPFASRINVRNIDEIVYHNHQQEPNVPQQDDNIVINGVANTSNGEGSGDEDEQNVQDDPEILNGTSKRRLGASLEESNADVSAVSENAVDAEDNEASRSDELHSKEDKMLATIAEVTEHSSINLDEVSNMSHVSDDEKLFKEVRVHLSSCDPLIRAERGSENRDSTIDLSITNNSELNTNSASPSTKYLRDNPQSTPFYPPRLHQSNNTNDSGDSLRADGPMFVDVSSIWKSTDNSTSLKENKTPNGKYVCDDDPLEGPSTLLSNGRKSSTKRKRSAQSPYVLQASLKRNFTNISDDEDDDSPLISRKINRKALCLRLSDSPSESTPNAMVTSGRIRKSKQLVVQRKRLPFKNQRAVIKVENKIKLEDTTTNSHKSSFSSTDGSTNSESNRNSGSPKGRTRRRKVVSYKEPSLMMKLRRSR